MRLNTLFSIGVCVWIGGATLGAISGNLFIREFSVNIVGTLTCLLGVFLGLRWIVRKVSGKGSPEADVAYSEQKTAPPVPADLFGKGMRIYSTHSVPEEGRDAIERAIQNDNFKPKGKDAEGRELLYIQTPSQDWLAVVEVTDAIIIQTAYRISPESVEQQIADYLAA